MNKIQQRLLSLSILLVGLGLYTPLYKKIYQSYIELTNQHEQPATVNHNSPLDVAVSPDGTEEYELTDRGIRVTNRRTGEQQEYKLPCRFPYLSWGTDIAYDGKRDLIAVVSLGGSGYFYRFDVKQRRWLDFRSLDDADLKSLTYDRVSDRYLAWGGGMLDEGYWGDDTHLVTISADGKILDYENLAPQMPGLSRLGDRINGSKPIVKIKTNGNDIALMAYSSNRFSSTANKPLAIWRYNLDSQIMRFVNCNYGRYW